MKKIQVLGPGCAKCVKLTDNVKQAVEELDIDCEVEKITDIETIVHYGILMTPGLVVDGEMKSAGKVLSPEEIKKLIS